MSKASLGRAAEELAAGFLERSGYRIMARNYRTRYAEIDIIAREAGVICFVEVRCKNFFGFGSPEESITAGKRKRIAKAALQYLQEQGLGDACARFDVVGVKDFGGRVSVNLIRNAFELEGEP